jgi:hypothetical protein
MAFGMRRVSFVLAWHALLPRIVTKAAAKNNLKYGGMLSRSTAVPRGD